jgi:hypothetical protein
MKKGASIRSMNREESLMSSSQRPNLFDSLSSTSLGYQHPIDGNGSRRSSFSSKVKDTSPNSSSSMDYRYHIINIQGRILGKSELLEPRDDVYYRLPCFFPPPISLSSSTTVSLMAQDTERSILPSSQQLREISTTIMEEIFSSILSEDPMKEYAKSTITQAMPKKFELTLSSGDHPVAVQGREVYGVYIEDTTRSSCGDQRPAEEAKDKTEVALSAILRDDARDAALDVFQDCMFSLLLEL